MGTNITKNPLEAKRKTNWPEIIFVLFSMF